jgi:hypothetical protein
MDNDVEVDDCRCFPELITPIQVDVLPGNRGNLFAQGCPLGVTDSFLVGQYV